MSGNIHILRRAGFAWQCPFSRRELEAVLDAMRRACGLDGVSLELILADDGVIAGVNAHFLGCAGPTNILSFPPASRPGMGGEPGRTGETGGASLVLSLDTLERECLLYGQNAAEHALRLLAHGMAHAAGLDHGPAMDAAQHAAFAAGKDILSWTEQVS